MEKIILYSEKDESHLVAATFSQHQVTWVHQVKSLVRALTRAPLTAALFVWNPRNPAELAKPGGLLTSIHQAFPKLNIFVFFSPTADPVSPVQGIRFYPIPLPDETAEEIRRLLAGAVQSEKRRHNRFGWPLKSALKNDEGEWELYRLHSLSAGGAFFAHPLQIPPAGSRREAIIQFQNCRFRVKAEVLDTRRNSSNMPFGFGVKFIDLDQDSEAAIDRIVNDALVKQLLNPGAEQKIPTIGEEILTPHFELS